MIAEVKKLGVRVSLFMDAGSETLSAAARAGADRIELYTEPYAQAFGTPLEGEVLALFAATAHAAASASAARQQLVSTR